MRKTIIFGIIFCTFLAAGGCEKATEPVSESEILQAKEALKPFKKGLFTALITGMAEGPEVAVNVCKLQAPAIAENITNLQITVGRVSHKTRNSANKATGWLQPLLAHYVENPTDKTPQSVRLENNVVGYVEPIFIKPLCLTCHGASVEAGLLAQIQSQYPADEAVGFVENDFRGLFWITLPADSK